MIKFGNSWDWWEMHVHPDVGCQVWIRDGIGHLGGPAEAFTAQLNAFANRHPLEVHIDSDGGDAREGILVGIALRAYGNHVQTIVDGVAAGAAATIAMAGDEIVMAPGSRIVLDAGFLEEAADKAVRSRTVPHRARAVNQLTTAVADLYAQRCRAGGSAEQWRNRMRAGAWYSAEEAVQAGLADRVGRAEKPPYYGDPVYGRLAACY